MSEIPELPEMPPEVDDDIALVRDLIRRTHPDTVPELIIGATIADLFASIPWAQAAYSRVAESIPAPTVTVPAGGNTPVLVEADSLPTSEKIRRGLAAHRPQGATHRPQGAAHRPQGAMLQRKG